MVIFKTTFVDVPYFIPSGKKNRLTISMTSIGTTRRLTNAALSF